MAQPFPALRSRIDPRSEPFKKNSEENGAAVSRLREALAASRAGGGEKYVARHQAKGQLLPRERLELLLDPDSHFLELCPLAGHGIRGVTPGASVVAGRAADRLRYRARQSRPEVHRRDRGIRHGR